jgi:hypothetical protein
MRCVRLAVAYTASCLDAIHARALMARGVLAGWFGSCGRCCWQEQ